MAGIGFELRKILEKNTLLSVLEAYGFAGLIGSGPWVLSILGVMIIGLLSYGLVFPTSLIIQFLVSVTYLMAGSLILTGSVQLLFTRFIADRLFEEKYEVILPNLNGLLILIMTLAGVIATVLALTVFYEPFLYEVLMIANFVLLSGMWVVGIFLTSVKRYKQILWLFAIGYGIAVLGAWLFASMGLGLSGLLMGVLFGHAVLFFGFYYIVAYTYPSRNFSAYNFMDKRQIYISLLFTGLFFNLGVWIDKLIFWYIPEVSQSVVGPLRSSIIYDLPIFLAYLSVIPGMAVFMVRMEADFAEHYDKFYDAVRNGDTLSHIKYYKDEMVYSARQGIYEIFKVQGFTVLILLLFGKEILSLIGISPLYAPLFYIDVVGVGLQVLFLSILNVMFYLDYRKETLFLTGLFLLLNAALTWFSIRLGLSFFGYGFAMAMFLTVIVGLLVLSRKLSRLEYETFMLQ